MFSNLKIPSTFFSSNAEETIEIGRTLARALKPGKVLALQGDLGAGKTTLIKGLAAHCKDTLVNSPTFTYLQIYTGVPPLFHFDLYRLSREEQFIQMGFTDYFEQDGICCIEWPQRIRSLLPASTLWITIEHLEENKRKIGIRELE